jgi:hypothetical protein
MRPLSMVMEWAVLIFVLVAVLGLMLLSDRGEVQAQQRPYVGYRIEGGCLYITPQGYAVIREWSPLGSVKCQ